jgi:hypothetical protein
MEIREDNFYWKRKESYESREMKGKENDGIEKDEGWKGPRM